MSQQEKDQQERGSTDDMESRLLSLAAAGNVHGLQCLGYQIVDELRRARLLAQRLWRAIEDGEKYLLGELYDPPDWISARKGTNDADG